MVVAMSASLPETSASVHHEGANSSHTMRPPAASAAAMRGSACSYGTEVIDDLDRNSMVFQRRAMTFSSRVANRTWLERRSGVNRQRLQSSKDGNGFPLELVAPQLKTRESRQQ